MEAAIPHHDEMPIAHGVQRGGVEVLDDGVWQQNGRHDIALGIPHGDADLQGGFREGKGMGVSTGSE